MKKRITDNSYHHDFEINQIVIVDRTSISGDYWSNGRCFDNDDCEDFDDYKPGDKVRIKQDTLNHELAGKIITIKQLRDGTYTDDTRSYMTESGMIIPERDFDCYEGETYVNSKETKTMKYKIGDKVKIVACKHGHGFDIGEVVVITEITDEDNYRGEYLDGHDYWYVEDDEIEPVSPLITRPHDYTGCDPEIAEALKQGLDVYCEVWDDDEDPKLEEWITQYLPSRTCRYWEEGMYWKHARPISQELKPKTKLVPKPASEIFAWLENPENGYKQTGDGKFWEKENEPAFTEKMVKYCGKDSLAGYDWHPEWLREVPVAEPEPVSEVSENSKQMYKVGDEVEVTEESWSHDFKLGDRVRIVGYCDTDYTYKCERLSDCRKQWINAMQLKPVPKIQTATVIKQQTTQLSPDDRVTIVRQDEDGYYLCEWKSGIRVWMRPDQLKFD